MDEEIEPADSLAVQDEPKSSASVLKALEQSKKTFEDWQSICDEIDDIYSRRDRNDTAMARTSASEWIDAELDLFWASYEILKPATYAHVPKPVVAPQFKDRRAVKNKTAELLERTTVSSFDRSNIDEVMCEIRDDVIFTNRGVMWLTYEDQSVCFEHLDRQDFRHEPARKWCEVGWVARRAWMTRKEMRKRFKSKSGDAYQSANLTTKREQNDNNAHDNSKKASVWEVWHKADNKVYWVSEGVDVLLDHDEPHLKLSGFFPCPRPAYGTLARRTLIPVPDYERYATHFSKINVLTSRIYLLLEKVKMKGLIPGGGDIGNAIGQLINADNDEILIEVPAAAMIGNSSGVAGFVQWMPLDMVATTIQGLISARGQLIEDFYQLSGISDIMRGATDAEETLGAQQLKSQYGSVRVREKIQELQRIARDAVRIAAEIAAENFSKETLLEMSQMEIPSKADIEKQVKGIEDAAEQELKALTDRAEKEVQNLQQSGQQPDPQQMQQAEQQFQQAQQEILRKYGSMLNSARSEVPIEDVMKLLRDDKARGFAFEIEDGSTIWADEQAEKQSRNEFMAAFSAASTALMPLVQTGPEGAALAGAMMKFQLAPFRTGRELESLIDDWIDSIGNMPAQTQDDGSAELAAAQKALAEAEGVKAQAAMASVQARAAQAQADNERKMAEMQMKSQESAMKLQQENDKLQLQLADLQSKDSKTQAEIDKLRADTAKILASIGLDVRRQELEEYRTANAAQQQQVDTALKISGEGRAERGEERADRQQEFNEISTDRQMSMSERQAQELD